MILPCSCSIESRNQRLTMFPIPTRLPRLSPSCPTTKALKSGRGSRVLMSARRSGPIMSEISSDAISRSLALIFMISRPDYSTVIYLDFLFFPFEPTGRPALRAAAFGLAAAFWVMAIIVFFRSAMVRRSCV